MNGICTRSHVTEWASGPSRPSGGAAYRNRLYSTRKSSNSHLVPPLFPCSFNSVLVLTVYYSSVDARMIASPVTTKYIRKIIIELQAYFFLNVG